MCWSIIKIASIPLPPSTRLRMVSGVTPMACARSKAWFFKAGIIRETTVAAISVPIPNELTVAPRAATWSTVIPLCAPTAPTRFTKSAIGGAEAAVVARSRSMVEPIFSMATAEAEEPSIMPWRIWSWIFFTSPVAMAIFIISVAASWPISGRAISIMFAASVKPWTSSSDVKPNWPAAAEISIRFCTGVRVSSLVRLSDRRPTCSAVKPVVLRTSPILSESVIRSLTVVPNFCMATAVPI